MRYQFREQCGVALDILHDLRLNAHGLPVGFHRRLQPGARLGDEGLQELPIPERLQPFADERDERLMPFRLLTREFLRGVAEGTSPAPSFYDGYRCQQVMDAVRESSASGRRVSIED